LENEGQCFIEMLVLRPEIQFMLLSDAEALPVLSAIRRRKPPERNEFDGVESRFEPARRNRFIPGRVRHDRHRFAS
jgi:hypothetical protein